MALKDAPVDAADRRDLYALAARLFAAEIDAPIYRQLASIRVELMGRPAGLSFVEPDLDELGAEEAVEVLAVEYCRLFVGPRALCPPRDAAANLSSLAHLYDDLASGARPDAPLAAIRELLRDRVLPWMPRFLDDVERHAERVLYRSIARLTRALLEEERDGSETGPRA